MDLLAQVIRNRDVIGTLLQDPEITEIMVIRSLARYLAEGEIRQVVNELTLGKEGVAK